MRRALAMFGIGLLLALGPATGVLAAGPASVFVDDDNNCNDPNRQASSLPAPSGTLYVWLNTGAPIDSTAVYTLQWMPLSPGGTAIPGAQTVNFLSCGSSTWAAAEVGYGGIAPGRYAYAAFDPSGTFLGADTIRFN